MGDFKINEKTVFTQSGGAEPAMGSTVTDIPGAGITGTLVNAVQDNITRLGTVTSGNLSNNNIVMPRFKEFGFFLKTGTTTSSTASQTDINISGTEYVTMTPEHANDIFEFSWAFNFSFSDGYGGYGVQKATNTGFSSGVTTIWSTGGHASGQHGHDGDMGVYNESGGTYAVTATTAGMTAGTTYYLRMIGMTHNSPNCTWGNGTANSTGTGVNFNVKRWSIV